MFIPVLIVEVCEEMDEVARNLLSFRLDHDYTPLTSPRQQSPVQEIETVDELAEALSLFEGAEIQTNVLNTSSKNVKVVRTTPKSTNKKNVSAENVVTVLRTKTKPSDIKQPKISTQKQKTKEDDADAIEYDDDEDYEDEEEDGDNDSDFEIDSVSPKQKIVKRYRIFISGVGLYSYAGKYCFGLGDQMNYSLKVNLTDKFQSWTIFHFSASWITPMLN